MSAALGQPVRFLIVGTAGYFVSVGAFAALYALGLPYVAASIASYLIANALTYVGNRYFTFRLGHDRFWRAYATYIVAGLIVVGLVVVVLAALVEGLGVNPVIGQAIALAVTTPVAFILFKRWTFRLR
jgi:putative flippase GtrA